MTRIGQRISDAIQERVEHRDYSIRKLSLALDVTAEQTRRFVRGEQIPRNPQLKKICKELRIPYQEALRLAQLDRMQNLIRHSPIQENPRLQIICMLWPRLSEQAQVEIMQMAHAYVKQKTMAVAG